MILPCNLKDSTDAVAEELTNKRPVVPNILRDVVRIEARAINDVTATEIASLRAKIDVVETFLSSSNLPPELKALLKSKTKKRRARPTAKGDQQPRNPPPNQPPRIFATTRRTPPRPVQQLSLAEKPAGRATLHVPKSVA